MKNLALYRIPIAYLLFYVIAILVTGIWLFLLSQGLDSSEGFNALLLEIIAKPEMKSLHNFVEVAAPHMFAMGAMVFVVAHFMLFNTKVSQKRSLMLSSLLYIAMFGNIFAYLAIMFGFVLSGWIKILSILLFVGLFLILLGMVAFSL